MKANSHESNLPTAINILGSNSSDAANSGHEKTSSPLVETDKQATNAVDFHKVITRYMKQSQYKMGLPGTKCWQDVIVCGGEVETQSSTGFLGLLNRLHQRQGSGEGQGWLLNKVTLVSQLE
ncbi:hypothetical protein RRG08_051388 [Elysia crispata]|uniref:Uncharacterized protein n=1 Tax=Elysia crispata TaxID=231223 RepID=A0AAE1B433_9GAST|nr:hypothetical protein RRG08_051388 [Elysia crispata]